VIPADARKDDQTVDRLTARKTKSLNHEATKDSKASLKSGFYVLRDA